jgi:hypothetical protein
MSGSAIGRHARAVTAVLSGALDAPYLGSVLSGPALAVPFCSHQNGGGQDPTIAVTVEWRDERRQPLQALHGG